MHDIQVWEGRMEYKEVDSTGTGYVSRAASTWWARCSCGRDSSYPVLDRTVVLQWVLNHHEHTPPWVAGEHPSVELTNYLPRD